MPSICFYFQVHQPLRIKKYSVFDIGREHNYFNDESDCDLNNLRVLEKVARKSYLPTNTLLLKLLNEHPEFKISFSLSGIVLEQLEQSFPEVLDSFKRLVATGRVELLSESYYHSLSFLFDTEEYIAHIKQHRALMKRLFGVRPSVLRNTELVYSNDLGHLAASLGCTAVLAEGVERVLGWRSPNFLYHARDLPRVKLLLKNYKLSDDVAFRFSNRGWQEHPLTAEKYSQWISSVNGSGDVVNLFMDYETFGEHQWEDTGIFEFLSVLPRELLRHPDNNFRTPSEVASQLPVRDELDYPDLVSWADTERDLTAWTGNDLQQDSLRKIAALRDSVLQTSDTALQEDWRRLQTSDHFYYMCTKWFSDGDVHEYFNPYDSPYDAYISYMNVINDMHTRVADARKAQAAIHRS